MNDDDDQAISHWMVRLADGDSLAANKLFQEYFERLVSVARKRLTGGARRDADEEDVAAEAFQSFFRGVERNRFPTLNDRTDLWRLLVTIVIRKSANRIKHVTRDKRGGGATRGDSIFADDDAERFARLAFDKEPNPEFVVEFTESTSRLISCLEPPELRTIALLKLEGYLNDEIAAELDVAERTVERKLRLIRQSWVELDDE